jgi:hypothetical protein
LRPRPVKFDIVWFRKLSGPHIANDADDFGRKAGAVIDAEENLSAERILVRE